MSDKPESTLEGAADPEWFRAPTRRELKMGVGLFLGFGLFFFLMFYIERDSRFRWVILGLAVISTVRGFWHWVGVIRTPRDVGKQGERQEGTEARK